MSKALAIPVAALLLNSCVTRTVRTSSLPSTVAKPNSVAAVMKRHTVNAVDAGDGDAIANRLRTAMTADPKNLAVRMALAAHYEEIGYPELAVEHYRLAAERFPDSEEVALALAKSLRATGSVELALRHLESFSTAHPAPSVALLAWTGILRDESGQLAKAEESYRAALTLRPKSDSLHNNLGYNLLLQGKREAAAQEFRAALAIEPYSQVARNNLGSALASQPKQAVVYLQSVADPATAHSNLAAVMIEQGDYTGARKELEVALGYKKDHEAALRNLQIVSELDGQASVLPAAIRKASRLQRLARGVGRVVLGIEDKKKDGDVQRTASK